MKGDTSLGGVERQFSAGLLIHSEFIRVLC